jgi:hypothetical protein
MASSSPTRATALASELRQFAGWLLTVNCPGCRVLRTVTVETLMTSHGGAISLGNVVRRLRTTSSGPGR